MIEAPNLARHLGGPRIFIKRDDLTGVAFGGNKLRNLEFRLARAMEEKPDTVIVGLDLQSNSARKTAGACNKLGLRTILVLEGSRPAVVQGNLLVDYLLGAEVQFARDGPTSARDRPNAAEIGRQAGGRTSSTTIRCSTWPRRWPTSRPLSRCSSRWTARCEADSSICRRAARVRPESCWREGVQRRLPDARRDGQPEHDVPPEPPPSPTRPRR